MGKERNLIFGTAFLFVVITSGFSLITRLCSVMLFESISRGFQAFLRKDMVWLVIVIGVVSFFVFYFSKKRISVKQHLLSDKLILFSSGILVLMDGILSLSSSVPIRIMSLQSARTVIKQADNIAQSFLIENLLSNIVPIFIMLVQIGLGVIMIVNCKRAEK